MSIEMNMSLLQEGHALVLGGARSGKSSFAELLAGKYAADMNLPVTYIATAEVTDSEMGNRISRHQSSRPAAWQTIEEPLEVASVLDGIQSPQIVLVDCLSFLLNNWLFHEELTEKAFIRRQDELVTALLSACVPVIMVSNEVGYGLVPADAGSRTYRDWLGWLNQAVARVSNHVYLVVAGIPVDVRKWQASW
jgi:adenosylcobinamide kinase / adenosylcobinamide-phosphate guanylyltransferase